MEPGLIACDMDGTLLDAAGQLPPGFISLHQRLQAQGIIFAPASGRQLATLQDMFSDLGPTMSCLAENGAVVYSRGEIISTTALCPAVGHALVDAITDRWEAGKNDLDIVICLPHKAFIHSRKNIAGEQKIKKYYHSLGFSDELHETISQELIKVAIYTRDNAENHIDMVRRAAASGAASSSDFHAVVSGEHWIDVMSPKANKGYGLEQLRQKLGIAQSETIAFGDYLNDYELLREAGTAWAMANAHPRVQEIADHTAPSNEEHGVMRVLEEHYGL
ncbi:Cof-type HAD-IIB family hydrolase [Corynebacterium sp. 3HC-13]|uniref:HAD family hydrolase n=1 Tax=Corynebacterium poyangense TaxID=2684405 RepID=UPI001CCA6BD1|nr:HAD family hydrolase [Corynebacterium poyangense]MBZ8176257.1 Cof-type HAD-IIB family hydrolase [Corynebacterium poyangense]